MSDIERWMRDTENTLAEHDRRIRSKPIGDPGGGANPIGPAGGALTGTYPNPTLASGSVTGGAGGAIADGTITDADVAPANKDGAAGTASMRTLGTGAQQAVAGNDARLSNARTPTAHTHDAADIVSGTLAIGRIPTGTSGSTVALGNHTHTLSGIVAGGTLAPPLVLTVQGSTPGSVPAGSKALYFKADGYAYTVDSAGVERPLIPKPDQLHLNATYDSTISSTDSGGCGPAWPARLMPANWSFFWCNAATPADAPYVSSDDIVTLEGLGRSMRVQHFATGLSTQRMQSSAPFAVTPGGLLTIAVWVRADAGIETRLGIHTSPPAGDPGFFGSGNNYWESSALGADLTWRKYTMSVVVPAGHTKARLTLTSTHAGAAVNGSSWWDNSESSLAITPPAQVMTGTISMWPTTTAPEGYLLCRGGTFDSVAYPTLAALLGDTYGTHSGTTYYLPNFNARVPVGVGGNAGGTAGLTNNYSLGQKYGDERLHNHYHDGVTSTENQYHQHDPPVAVSYSGAASSYRSLVTGNDPFWSMADANNRSSNQTVFHTHNFNTNNAGGGTTGNVMPVLGINFIIKT